MGSGFQHRRPADPDADVTPRRTLRQTLYGQSGLKHDSTPRLIQALRRTRLGLHLLWGTATVACAYPFIRESQRRWLTRRWARQLLDILAVRLDAQLAEAMPGSLIVANHISWLDIYALNATRPMVFVAKAEVRHWPLIGWLAAKTDTVFLRRGSCGHARLVNTQINALLNAGSDVAIFPEGTTTDGTHLLNFHGALMQAAVDAGRPVQPVAVSYHDANGHRSLAPAYAGETTMSECLDAILACRSLTVRLRPTPPIASQTRNRRELAHEAQCAIAFSLKLEVANAPLKSQPEINARVTQVSRSSDTLFSRHDRTIFQEIRQGEHA